MNSMNMREATIEDAVQLSQLIRRTIQLSNSQDYDEQSIGRLCEIFQPKPVAERIENELIFLCFDGPDLIGTGGLKQDYLRSVFVEPTLQKQGLGKTLVAKLEEIARQRAITTLMVHSSLTARRFYDGLGYEFIEMQSYPVGPFVLMKKALKSQA